MSLIFQLSVFCGIGWVKLLNYNIENSFFKNIQFEQIMTRAAKALEKTLCID